MRTELAWRDKKAVDAPVVKGLAVAALAAMGEAGDDKLGLLAPLLTDEIASYCLNMSKLNLYQCLAVSKPQYEDIFCLGQHSMIDIGNCVVKAAGSDPGDQAGQGGNPRAGAENPSQEVVFHGRAETLRAWAEACI